MKTQVYLNKEIYLLRIQAMSDEELAFEKSILSTRLKLCKNVNAPNDIFTERLEVLNHYLQIKELLKC